MLALCMGIADLTYNAFVRIIVLAPQQGDSNDFRSVLLKRAAFVVQNSTTPAAVIAGKCFMFDLYQAESGISVSSNTALNDKHGFRHWTDQFSPGDGFLP